MTYVIAVLESVELKICSCAMQDERYMHLSRSKLVYAVAPHLLDFRGTWKIPSTCNAVLHDMQMRMSCKQMHGPWLGTNDHLGNDFVRHKMLYANLKEELF